MSTPETVLVTGGAGYIGSHTVRALRATGRDVVVLDSLELGSADAVVDAELVVGDIADATLVEELCRSKSIGSVVHFAAYKNVGESMQSPARYFHNNVDSSVQLLEAIRRAGVGSVVFSSSCSVYGTPDHVPVAETARIQPESVYAETKAMVERVLHWYDVTSDIRSVSLRYFNAAGASLDGRIGEDWQYALNLVPVTMKAVLLGREPIHLFGNDYPTPDGTCIRDYVHVEDLANAHVKALDYLNTGGTTLSLNVGTGVGSSVLDVLKATERVAGRPVPHEFGPRRDGDPVQTFADPRRSQEVLGWTAEHGLDEIIETAYQWHVKQAV